MLDEIRGRSKKDKVILGIFVFLIVALIIVAPFLPDQRPRRIREGLDRQGYNVEPFSINLR